MIAGAPISWGVSEVPGWGHQLRPERVLAEMRELGLTATEAGPDGFLPDDPAALRDYLAAYELELASGFTPLVLHADRRAPLDALEDARAVAGEHGLGVALHPRYGTLVQTPDEIERVLDGCRVPLCLDTGHIVLGGGDTFFEQDAQLAAEPEPGEGPRADVARSLAYLDAVIAS